jgi:hypothetical protein
LVLIRHYSWRNNAGTKLNVQLRQNVTVHQKKKVFGFSLTVKKETSYKGEAGRENYPLWLLPS